MSCQWSEESHTFQGWRLHNEQLRAHILTKLFGFVWAGGDNVSSKGTVRKNDLKCVTNDTKIMWDVECGGGLQGEYLVKFRSLGKCQIVIAERLF